MPEAVNPQITRDDPRWRTSRAAVVLERLGLANIEWTRQAVLFAVALSLFVHVLMMLAMSRLLLSGPMGATRDGKGESPLAMIAPTDLTEMQRVGLDAEAPALDSAMEPQLPSIQELMAESGEGDLAPLNPSALANLGGSGGASLGTGEGMDDGTGGGGAKFFGVEARGSRFAYIVDVSGSMEGDRIVALKEALGSSIQGLVERARFSIVLFSSGAVALTGNRWVEASDGRKREVNKELRAIQPFGGTDPLPAFDLVFAMQPRPDAIYFMTDGVFSDEVTSVIDARIARLNNTGSRRTPIHCITFIERGAEPVMRRIARQTGGTYTHVEGPTK